MQTLVMRHLSLFLCQLKQDGPHIGTNSRRSLPSPSQQRTLTRTHAACRAIKRTFRQHSTRRTNWVKQRNLGGTDLGGAI